MTDSTGVLVSQMRENLMSGSRWQGMETRHGDGTEALSQETESNGSATPKSRRHPLTLPAVNAIPVSNRNIKPWLFTFSLRLQQRKNSNLFGYY
jgi:hypothetical protein